MRRARGDLIFLLVLVFLLAIGGCGGEDEDVAQQHEMPETAPEGVVEYYIQSREHVEGVLGYGYEPPVGGYHNPVWQNCGFYDRRVRDEYAVHSMEHGAVWITYEVGLPQEQKDALRQLASEQPYVLASLYPRLPAPVVATAWGYQLQLEGTDDPRLQQFVDAFQQGPQTPEPGEPCTDGIGEPLQNS